VQEKRLKAKDKRLMANGKSMPRRRRGLKVAWKNGNLGKYIGRYFVCS